MDLPHVHWQGSLFKYGAGSIHTAFMTGNDVFVFIEIDAARTKYIFSAARKLYRGSKPKICNVCFHS